MVDLIVRDGNNNLLDAAYGEYAKMYVKAHRFIKGIDPLDPHARSITFYDDRGEITTQWLLMPNGKWKEGY